MDNYTISSEKSQQVRKGLKEMGKVTYKQACEVLDVEMVTIHKAIAKGLLTRCAHNTKTAMLLQEQIELFKGKRISERSLSLKEKELWEQYKQIAEDPESATDADHFDEVIADKTRRVAENFVTLWRAVSSCLDNPSPSDNFDLVLKEGQMHTHQILDVVLRDLDQYTHDVAEAMLKPQIDRMVAILSESLKTAFVEAVSKRQESEEKDLASLSV